MTFDEVDVRPGGQNVVSSVVSSARGARAFSLGVDRGVAGLRGVHGRIPDLASTAESITLNAGFFVRFQKNSRPTKKKLKVHFAQKNSTYRRLIQILPKKLKKFHIQITVFHGGHMF